MHKDSFQIASEYHYETHIADIIVVGGGLAGITAARTASELGAKVVVLDKGVLGHSGNTGINWGQTFVTAELSDDNGLAGTRFLTRDVMGILDQEHSLNVVRAQIEAKPREFIERSGCIFQRDDDGNVVGLIEGNTMNATPDAHTTHAAHLLRKQGISIFDNMMMIDILLDDYGIASGVFALDLISGNAHIFRGKKIILATGGFHWAKGVTSGSPDSTGEGHAALLRRHIAFKDMEFPQYDFNCIEPFGWLPDSESDMFEIGCSFQINGDIRHRFFNKHKRPFIENPSDLPNGIGISYFQETLIAAAKEFYAGNGTRGDGSNNGLLFNIVDLMDEPSTLAYPSYKGTLMNIEHNLDIELPDYCELLANEYSSCGTPWTNPETCETKLPGVYAAFVALSAMSSIYSWAQGYLSAKDAASKLNETPLSQPRSEDIKKTLDRTYNYLNRSPEGGIRSTEVFRSIQRAFYKGYGFMKDEVTMKSALDELKRIQKEDIPRMYCADKARVYNRDWKMAIESESMLICTIGALSAGIERKESRSPFFRNDYPKMDNDNFLCFLWTTLLEDGTWKVEKGDIVDTVMPREEIVRIIGEIDISVPNKRQTVN